MKELNNQASNILQVINEHDIAQLLLHILVAATLLWEIALLVALDS